MREFGCAVCGTKIVSNNQAKKYCSEEHRLIAHNSRARARNQSRREPKRTIACATCGKIVTTGVKNQKFCSRSCKKSTYYPKDNARAARRMRLARYVLGFMERRMPDQLAKLNKAFTEKENVGGKDRVRLSDNGGDNRDRPHADIQ